MWDREYKKSVVVSG